MIGVIPLFPRELKLTVSFSVYWPIGVKQTTTLIASYISGTMTSRWIKTSFARDDQGDHHV